MSTAKNRSSPSGNKDDERPGGKIDPTEFIFHFNAYQDNKPQRGSNELDVGMLPDDRFLDSQTERIKKGGTVEERGCLRLDDLSTPVDLVASENLDEAIGEGHPTA